MPAIPDVAAFDLSPDWICEVVSPSTARLDRVKKLTAYALHGIPHCWLVDPAERTLEVFRLTEGAWLRVSAFGEDDRLRAEPFQAIELDLSLLWL